MCRMLLQRVSIHSGNGLLISESGDSHNPLPSPELQNLLMAWEGYPEKKIDLPITELSLSSI